MPSRHKQPEDTPGPLVAQVTLTMHGYALARLLAAISSHSARARMHRSHTRPLATGQPACPTQRPAVGLANHSLVPGLGCGACASQIKWGNKHYEIK